MTPSIFAYAPELAVRFLKVAEHTAKEPKRPHPLLHAAKVVGVTGAGIGLGTGIGMGIEKAVSAGYQHATGQPLPESVYRRAAPFIGGGMGLLYGLLQAKHKEEMRRGIPDFDAHHSADGSPTL